MATVIGGNDGTTLNGGASQDTVDGGGGDDTLNGFKGKDVLLGGKGDDILNGGIGNDELTGGNGKDVFVFEQNSGKDVVTDFQVGKDMLEIAKGLGPKGSIIKKPQDVIDNAKQDGKDVVIDLGGGNKITLKDVDLKDLKKNPSDHFDIS